MGKRSITAESSRWAQRDRLARLLHPQAAICLDYEIQYLYWEAVWRSQDAEQGMAI